MNFTLDWLSEFIDIALPPKEIADKLTLAGLEVECYCEKHPLDDHIVVGKIESVTQHPNADRLSICSVRLSPSDVLSIVCGASNVRVGMFVACAQDGSRLPSGMKIKKSKIRQVVSQGMLCSASELSLDWWTQEEGIMDLPSAEDCLGLSVNQLFSLYHTVLYELNITPNRSDCLSVLGIARELCFLHEPSHFHCLSPHVISFSEASHLPKISILVDNACFSYAACVVKDCDLNRSLPFQWQQRLHLNRIPHKNPVVDILNYMMLHLGQPMHAFDLDTIEGNIHIRLPRPGEKVTLINNMTVICDPSTLVIADEKKIIAIAGVMGSLSTAVTEKTRSTLIESACFSPEYIMGQAKLYRLTSDAAFRFERGVDPLATHAALEETVYWLLHYLGGSAEPFIQAAGVSASKDWDRKVTVRLEKVNALLGMSVSADTFFTVMHRLSEGKVFNPSSTKDVLVVSAPSYRYDLRIEEDYIEEVARFIGYHTISDAHITLLARFSAKGSAHYRELAMRRLLVSKGYQEVLSLSFVSQEMHDQWFPNTPCIPLINPIAQQYSVLRADVLMSLTTVLLRNLSNINQCFHCFEIGPVFYQDHHSMVERQMLSLLSYGFLSPASWSHHQLVTDFFDVKGLISLLLLDKAVCRYVPSDVQRPYLHPGKSADIICDNEVIGYIGHMHPRLAAYYNFAYAPVMASLYLDLLPKKVQKMFAAFLRHPYIERDFSIIVDRGMPAGDIIEFIRSCPFHGKLEVTLFDLFSGDGLEQHQKSLAFRLLFQDESKNLEEEEIHCFFKGLIDQVCQRFHAILRGTI